MSKFELNWKNENDYAYTANLTDAGWAWEFIRRSETYRTAYQALKSEDFRRTVPQGLPPHFLTSDEKAKAMDTKFPAPPLTPAQKKAALWGLFDMYDPAIVYTPDEIHFDKRNKVVPVMYGPPGMNVRPIEEIYAVDDLPITPTTMAVFLDFSLDVSGQVERIKDAVKAYSSPEMSRRRRKEWPRYLRMLDARMDETLPEAKKIELIHPDKKWNRRDKTESMDDPDSTDWARYAKNTLEQAEQMVKEDFRFLLKTV